MGIGRNDLGVNLARPKSGGQREGVDVAVHFAIHKNSDPRKMRILISVSVKEIQYYRSYDCRLQFFFS